MDLQKGRGRGIITSVKFTDKSTAGLMKQRHLSGKSVDSGYASSVTSPAKGSVELRCQSNAQEQQGGGGSSRSAVSEASPAPLMVTRRSSSSTSGAGAGSARKVAAAAHPTTTTAASSTCICDRAKCSVMCTKCHNVQCNVRVAKTCSDHPNVMYLMDLECCPKCKKPGGNLIEI